MKRYLLTSLILAAALSAYSADFGGNISNNSKFADQNATDGLKLNQKDSVSVWFKTPFANSKNDYFLVQGKYQYENDFGSETTSNTVNLDTAKIVYTEEELTLTAGRFQMADLTGLIYNQTSDGLSLSYSIPALSITASCFYTGLQNSKFTTIIDPEFVPDTDSIYDLCPKYGVSALKVSCPSFFGEQTLSAEALFTAKFEDTNFIRNYTAASLGGPFFAAGLYYDVTGVVSFTKFDDNDFEMANLSKADIFLYPGFLDSVICASAVYTSGADEDNSGFIGFSSMNADYSLEESEYTSIFKSGLSASIKPVPSLLVSGGADVLFSTADKKFEYRGFQYNAGINWQILSDLLAGCDVTQYFDDKNSDINKLSVTVRAVLTF